MPLCSYCDQEQPLVREDLIPEWFHTHVPAWDEPARARGWMVRTDLQVDDICTDCHDRLARPARYGRQLFEEQLVRYLYADSAEGFVPDHPMLVRWLLRLSYDAARLHGEELGVLAQYRDVATGRAEVPPELQLWLRTITPTRGEADAILLALRGDSTPTQHPDWFRIGVLGVDNCDCLSWSFRQVAINSFCFMLCLPDPSNLDDARTERIRHTNTIDAQLQGAAWLGPGSNIWLPAPTEEAITYTLGTLGCFHLGCELVESAVIASALGPGSDPVEYRIERKDIEAGDITPFLAVLADLVATKEVCLRMQQRLAVSITGYEGETGALFASPDVRSYLRAVDQAWPYWMFFQHPESRWLKLLSVLLSTPARGDSGEVRQDTTLLAGTVRSWFQGLNELCYLYGIDSETGQRVSAQAHAILMSE
jgi:hypothetical protein